MKLVIKVGGQALEEFRQRRNLARQVAELRRAGHNLLLVHGGGQKLTETLTKLSIPTRFINGLRVTDASTRDIAVMVLAGIVNKQLVAALEAQGAPALGICGGDAGLIRARKIHLTRNGTRGAARSEHDLGFVGRPQKVNTRLVEIAFREGLVPVVASLALGSKGEYLNVNADDFAAALAVALKADRLLYLTQAGGVWDSEHRLLPVIESGEIRRLIQSGVVRDGMIPKLLSCARTLRHMAGEIDILPADAPNVLLAVSKKNQQVGTRIVNKA